MDDQMSNLPLFAQPPIENNFNPDADVVLFNGDANIFTRMIPDRAVQLVVTPPPYNLGKAYENRTGIESYLEQQTALIADIYRILSDNGSVCWQVGNYVEDGEVFPLDMYYYPIFKRLGFQLRNRIIWHFGHGLHASKRFSGRYETMLWFTKTDNYVFNLDPVRVPSKYPGKRHYKGDHKGEPSGNPLGKNPSDIWQIMCDEWETGLWDIPNVKSNHPEKTIHPCQFPVELVERCVLAFSNEGDIVFDPYAGVGSSLIAALKRDRKAIGCEKEADYVALTSQRISDYYAGVLKTRPIGKPIHVPTGREKVAQMPQEWQEKCSH